MRFLTAVLAAAVVTAAPAMADTMASPTPSPSSMHSMHSMHSMKSSSMQGHSMKSSSMKGSNHMMATPKPKATHTP